MRRYSQYKEGQLRYLEQVLKILGLEYKREIFETKTKQELTSFIDLSIKVLRERGFTLSFRIKK